jgi:hypothetical protein
VFATVIEFDRRKANFVGMEGGEGIGETGWALVECGVKGGHRIKVRAHRWSSLHGLFTTTYYLFLLVVVSFMVNHFLSDAMMLIKLSKRVGVDEELAV